SGMTGTAETEAAEFHSTYKLDVIVIPTHMPMVRKDNPDMIYRTLPEKWDAVVEEIKERYDHGQPLLVGTVPVENSELIAGGLQILGTERHESRRIDNQLRGRAGRQGDPGSSRFFLSLEDDLMRIFAGDKVKALMQRLGMEKGVAIESKMVSKRIAAAQKSV